IFSKGEAFWQCNAGGGVLEAGDSALIDQKGKHLEVPNTSLLGLQLKEPYGFHVTFFRNRAEPSDEVYVAISSTDYSRTVTIYAGDNQTILIAFFVSKDIAWTVVQHFCRTGQMANVVRWVKMTDQTW